MLDSGSVVVRGSKGDGDGDVDGDVDVDVDGEAMVMGWRA